MTTPYIGFSNDTLERQPKVAAGDTFVCPHCSKQHALEAAQDDKGQDTDVALFYNCRGKAYLGAVGGRLIVGVEADASGEADL